MRYRISLLTVLLVMILCLGSLWGQSRGTRIPFHGRHSQGGYGGWGSNGWKGVGGSARVHRGHWASWRSSFWGRNPYPGAYLGRGLRAFFYGYRPAARNYSSSYFVETWKDRNPSGMERDLSIDSSLLSPGMDHEEVMRRLGSPIHRRRVEDGERWKYSSFTLIFSSGVLTGIR